MTTETETEPNDLRNLIEGARVVLWDFDGPVCRLFAGHSAERVARDLVDWLEGRGLHGLLDEPARESLDPHVVLRAVDRRHPGSDLVAELEERLTQEELKAAASARPTPYADPLVRTWTAVGARLAITTNNSPRVVKEYLTSRGLLPCFAPHLYGRTQELRYLKPHPHCVQRALNAMGAAPSTALMIGDTPSDFLAARAAGVPFLGYARNERKTKVLEEAGAEMIVGSLEPVLKAVREAGQL
ncbi:HAD-IA family hydrolase [Streptomyces griseoincarnatus]|uniref:HAD-IA family hydrolase n=1 Tax=Streptomyces griseoincarnatus TaxID=29305 RepID=A0ABT0VRQ9_STRGI|nr:MULTISPECIES: HAD-IA family hydrolase [Streptomyces]MBJ6615975.1 HAD family hydrolase [Streptomyces sp. I3(2020)]MBJ6626557.1 HAD family hydrolase [Streptomyces sp. I4(2020)]MCM2514034.1 HAD-IA family hydrolase [Streptomyces griseoincarnatus]